ncbi:MAG: 4-hydroxyphenylpyruvate dioxygenase [Cyanobacteria bacterium J06558_2]
MKRRWINSKNPLQTDGFGFIEFATKSPQKVLDIFIKFGFILIGRHHSKSIFLLQQGEVKFIVNAAAETDASSFEHIHGSIVCGVCFRVEDSNFAVQEAVRRGAKAVICSDYELPAIEGIGGSKIYLLDSHTSKQFFASFFNARSEIQALKSQVTCIDHITHNVSRGNMEFWAKFYGDIFNFQEIRFFDIKGQQTGLRSKALVSPCGKIRIPINESQDDVSQVAEFLQRYNGEGIQHIALGCQNIYSVVGKIKHQGIKFQDTPNTYYDLLDKRIPNHQENVAKLKSLKILIDSEPQQDKILLQIFTKESIGPIFFEFIERKGNQGFGEGNFQALFESIELDQVRRGVLTELIKTESFTAISLDELASYANPSLSRVAFGEEKEANNIIKFPVEHGLFQFIKRFSTSEIAGVALSLFSILLYKYTSQEQFKLCQYQIDEKIYRLNLACNLTEKSYFSELLASASKLADYKFNYDHNFVNCIQNANASYGLAYFVREISPESRAYLTQNYLITSEMCLLLDGKSNAYLAYDKTLFNKNFITDFIRHFDILIQNIHGNHNSNLGLLSLTSDADVTLQHNTWQTPRRDYGTLPVHGHFERYAEKSPDSIAITFGTQQISYDELNCRANQLARYLIEQNVRSQDCVGVFVEAGTEILISILAIHKINAVYVPIDIEYPLGRITALVQQLDPAAILGTSDRLMEINNNLKTNIIDLSAINLSKFKSSNLNYSASPDSISHIFFTSGTTGTPKGVVSSHGNLIHYIFTAQEKYRFGADDSFLSATRHTFSISLLMLLMPLVCGGQVNMITLEQLLEPKLLAEAIERTNFFHLVPSVLKVLLDFLEQENYSSDRFSHVKHAATGGDMIPAPILNRLNRIFTQAEVYAVYGSSEISCMGCTYLVPKDTEIEQTLVGKPFNNVQLRVLDRYQRAVPVGVKGEIYFSGSGISQGYLNLPYRTQASYILLDGDRFYRTGDIGRLTPQGNLQMLGRDDNQVQIRGMRIELGEIESSLNLHLAIAACVVIAKENTSTEKQLVAYLISQNQSPTSKELRGFLEQTLPQYMIPNRFIFVEQFPLNPNGKVDRRALSLRELKPDSQPLSQARTVTEKQLATIWSEVLKLETVSVTDNFFDLGGHSLLATKVMSRIRETLEVELSISSLFAFPTIAALAKQIEITSPDHAATPILPTPRQSKIPLSLTQKRLWFLYQLEPNSSAYNIPLALEIKGELQIKALKGAIVEIVRRHQILRTNFQLIDNIPTQVVHPTRDISLKVIDLRSLSTSQRSNELSDLMQTEIKRPFELTQEALLRTTLFQQTTSTQILLVTIHHIVADAWSLEIFTKELSSIYTAIVNGQPSPLPELSIQYCDFAHWQREYLKGEIYQTQLDYWQKQLAGLPPLLELPTDQSRPAVQSFHGGVERFNLDSELTAKLQILSQKSGVTLFMTLLACFAILLSRYSNAQDIAIGSPIANRNRREIEPLIGFFVNTLVLRTNLEGNPSFEELLQRVRQTTLDAYTHSELQFDQLVEVLQPERSLSYNPLFQVMLILQNGTVTTQETSHLRINPLPLEQITAQFDLTLSLEETEQGLGGFWQYNSDLFAADTIKRMTIHFETLLAGIIPHPERPISELPLLTAAESQQLLVKWNNTKADYPQDKCIHQLFESQAAKTPDALAIVFEAQQLTYRELNIHANRLAHYLQKLGVKPETLVAICVERSLEMVIGLLGILKAGGAYIPLDPSYEQERLSQVLSDSQASILLTQPELVRKIPQSSAQVVSLASILKTIESEDRENPASDLQPDNLAYVIYTSGSTGKPKGVQISHRNVVNFLSSISLELEINPLDTLLSVTTISFDISVLEIFAPLTAGARLKLVSQRVAADGAQLLKALQLSQATIMQGTPITWRLLLAAGWTQSPQLKILCGGETLPLELAHQLSPRGRDFWNLYGPTETTIWSSIFKVELAGGSISIGRPIANTQFYVLDRHLQPVPVGVTGELHIGGAGVARGYLNRPEFTAEKFISIPPQSPLSKERNGDRLYKTGDLGRYLPDGNIEYLGRIDSQVKVRGFRIELGEIESVLDSHPEIKQAVVIATDDISGTKSLVAYLTADSASISTAEVRQFLKQKLPEYMVPSVLMVLEDLPLTSNGKIDRRSLPAPEQPQDKTASFVAPQDELELQLTKIWEKVLGIRAISINDNFFELGGHSLLAVMLFAEIEKLTGKNLPLSTLFQAPRIRELANIIRDEGWSSPWTSLVPIKPGGSKRPFFCVHGAGGHVLNYYSLSRHLSPQQPFYALQAQGLDGQQPIHDNFPDMAAHYIKEMRELQPEGPYFLGGYCGGGKIAYEMAQQLYQQGQEVGVLALFNTFNFPQNSQENSGQLAAKVDFLIRDIGYHWGNLSLLKPRDKLTFLRERIRWAQRRFQTRFKASGQMLPLASLLKLHDRLIREYAPEVYPGRVTIFQTRKLNDRDYDSRLGWAGLAQGGIEFHEIPAYFRGILVEPFVQSLAQQLEACLDRAEENK